MKTGIIIPCYNEAKRIDQQAFIDFAITHEDYHLCFVNDGSTDNTNDVLEKMQWKSPYNISVVDIKKNAGKAAAVRSGSQYMYGVPGITSIGFMDADLSTDFRDFKDLVKTLHREEKIMVFGSRNTGKKSGIERDFVRGLISKFVKQFILLILGLPIRDTQCGAKVFKKEVVPMIYAQQFVSRWLFDVEIFLRLKRNFGKQNLMQNIFEQPLMRWVHVDDSKLGVKDSIKIPFNLAQIWMSYTVGNTQKGAGMVQVFENTTATTFVRSQPVERTAA